jgi:hypothetical protein
MDQDSNPALQFYVLAGFRLLLNKYTNKWILNLKTDIFSILILHYNIFFSLKYAKKNFIFYLRFLI